MIEHYVIFPQSNKPETPAFPEPWDKYNNGNSKKYLQFFKGIIAKRFGQDQVEKFAKLSRFFFLKKKMQC